jgi:hypothetical protein
MDLQRMGGWLSRYKNHLLFYFMLFLGISLFSGLKASMLATLLILFLNISSERLTGYLFGRLGLPASLIIQSVFSLGLFPFLWLATVFVAGASYPWVLGVLLLFLAVLSLSIRKSRPASSSRISFELIFVILLILLTTYAPFSHVGKPQQQGLAYRAYFSSDYLKHFSVVEAINKGHLPPQNPYFEGENFHYYWLVYATPAFLARLSGSVPTAMFSWSFTVNFLFLASLLLLVQQICVRRRVFTYFLAAASLTVSLEGLYFFIQKCGFHFPKFLSLGSEYNIDALTRWLWNLPQIDTLLRSMLYTPQHLMGISLLLVFFLVLFLDINRPLLLSSIIAMTLAASFFVGGILLFAWFVYFLAGELRRFFSHKSRFSSILKSASAYFLLPLLTVALFQVLQMTELGWRSEFFFQKLSFSKIALLLFLNLGPLLLTGLAGCVLVRFPLRLFHLTLFLTALLVILFVRIRNFENDLSLKLGLVLSIQLLLFTALLFAKFRFRGILTPFLLLLLILPGMMTFVLDVRNAMDITNKRYTFYLPAEEKAVLNWTSQNTPSAAVVQTFPPAREWNVSIIPSFAGRNMFVGDRMHGRIFQVGEETYNQRLEILKQHFQNLPAAGTELKKMGIDYLFWGKPEFQSFGYYPPLKRAFVFKDTVLYSLE